MTTFSIILNVAWLVYEIRNKAHLTGESRRADNNYEQVANIQAGEDESQTSQIKRSIETAFSMLKNELSEYIIDATAPTSDISNALSSESDFRITLTPPSNFNFATVDSIKEASHNYVVYKSLGEWFVITDKTDAKDYFDMAASCIMEVRKGISKRIRPTKPTAQ